MTLLSQTMDETAKDSLIKDLKRQLLLRAAADLNCEKIFTGECATSLAITLLSGIKFPNLSSFWEVYFLKFIYCEKASKSEKNLQLFFWHSQTKWTLIALFLLYFDHDYWVTKPPHVWIFFLILIMFHRNKRLEPIYFIVNSVELALTHNIGVIHISYINLPYQWLCQMVRFF